MATTKKQGPAAAAAETPGPDVAAVRRQAEIATAEAERDISIKKAEASREAAVAQAGADQARVLAQSISQTKQAEAMRDLNLKKSEYEASVNQQKAISEKSYEISANQGFSSSCREFGESGLNTLELRQNRFNGFVLIWPQNHLLRWYADRASYAPISAA